MFECLCIFLNENQYNVEKYAKYWKMHSKAQKDAW